MLMLILVLVAPMRLMFDHVVVHIILYVVCDQLGFTQFLTRSFMNNFIELTHFVHVRGTPYPSIWCLLPIASGYGAAHSTVMSARHMISWRM